MKEKLEKVIADLEHEHNRQWELERKEPSRDRQWYRQGGQDGLQFAIQKLKEVLADEGEHRTQHHIPTKKET